MNYQCSVGKTRMSQLHSHAMFLLAARSCTPLIISVDRSPFVCTVAAGLRRDVW